MCQYSYHEVDPTLLSSGAIFTERLESFTLWSEGPVEGGRMNDEGFCALGNGFFFPFGRRQTRTE